MLSNKSRSSTVEYMLIIALYYVTGGAFSYTKYSLQISIFFIVSFVICIFENKQRLILRKKVIIPWYVMSTFVFIVPLLFGDSISTYIAIIMQISIGAFCAAIISPEDFKKKYTDIIIFFAGVSLIGFSLGRVIPSIAYRFPVTIGDASVDYYNAGIYVFMRAKGYAAGALVLTSRNAGICWEPGCYQAFLNIGLLFLLEAQEKEKQKYFYIKFFTIVVTIATTLSTTGIIILVILLLVYYRIWSGGAKVGWIVIPVFMVLLIFAAKNTGMINTLQEKLSREFGGDVSFINRISLNKLVYIFSDNGFPYILGMSFKNYLKFNAPIYNSILHSLLCLGTPFTIVHLVGYWKGSKVLAKNNMLLFIIMMMCFSTETLFWRVFFDTISFYGWIYGQQIKSRRRYI